MEAQNYTITGLRAVRENLVSQRSPAEVLGNAGVPAEHRFTTTGLIAAREHIFTVTGLMGCEGELFDAALSCGELGDAAVSCGELVDAAVSCGGS